LGSTLDFCQYLIEQGLLQAIAFLPAESMSGTSIPSAILIIDMQGDHEQVRFVDVEMAGFTHKDKRAVSLVKVDELIEKIHSPKDFEGIVSVSKTAIVDNDFDLTAARYPLNQAERAFDAYVTDQETIPLVKIVDFVRSLPVSYKNSEGNSAITVQEVSTLDVDMGYLTAPKKEVMVSERVVDEYEKSFLKAKDILLVSKGTQASRVAFVAEAPEVGEYGWVASQFVTVLRMKERSSISAEALFVFLRSQIGQRLLSRLSVGTSIANLSLAALKNLQVFVPSEEEQLMAKTIVQQDIEANKQILAIEADRQRRYESLWTVK
jgi:type I restriction enzyme M protein